MILILEFFLSCNLGNRGANNTPEVELEIPVACKHRDISVDVAQLKRWVQRMLSAHVNPSVASMTGTLRATALPSARQISVIKSLKGLQSCRTNEQHHHAESFNCFSR